MNDTIEVKTSQIAEKQAERSVEQRIAPIKPYQFKKGQSGNPKGRKPATKEEKAIKKAVKQYLEEYEQGLAEALPEISPALIAQAKKGNVKAIREVHEVVGAHKRQGGNVIVPIQINFESDREEFGK